jgi:hypothetical protein
MAKYILKLKDTPGKRENSKFTDCPLFYVRQLRDGKGGFWEYAMVTQFDKAMEFDSPEAAFEVAAQEHARNPFHVLDRLFICNGEEEIEISLTKLNRAASKLRRELQQQELAARLAAKQAKELAKELKKIAAIVPDIPATTVDIHQEIVELTSGGRPDMIGV